MVSRKDLNSAELDTVRVSKSPTTVVTANGEVQTKAEVTEYVKWLSMSRNWIHSRQWSFSKIHRPLSHSENSAKITDIPTSGQRPQLIKDGRRIKCNTENCVPIVVPGLSTSSSSPATPVLQKAVVRTLHPASTRSESTSSTVRAEPVAWTNRDRKNKQKWRQRDRTGNPLRDLPERLEEFTENIVDESVPAHRDAPTSSSHDIPLEPRAKVVPSKHNIFTHLPKDRNCDICMRTKITRAHCRKRTGTAVPRAEMLVTW